MTEGIEYVMSRFELVQKAVEIEPRIMQVFQTAIVGPYLSHNRWNEYERAKKQLYHLVGWDAADVRLRGCEYWEVCVIAVDYLLPESLYTQDLEAAAASALIGIEGAAV